ncbi:MAG: hypothetical protein RLN72_03795 [Henriciella sp.]
MLILVGACDTSRPPYKEAWGQLCFYELVVPAEEIERQRSQSYTVVFNKLFDRMAEAPESPPPLVYQNSVLFSEQCDFLETDNFVSDYYAQQNFDVTLQAIGFQQYRERYVSSLNE